MVHMMCLWAFSLWAGHNSNNTMRYSPTSAYVQNEPGIYTDLKFEDYRSAPGLANSDLKILQESPAKYRRGERTSPTEAMRFGSLANDLLLFETENYYLAPETYPAPESAKKDAPIIQKPWNWNSGYCDAWKQAHLDKPIIPRDGPHSAAWLKALRDKVRANPLAADLIHNSLREVSIFARNEDYPVLRKGRCDGLRINPDLSARITEIKTTVDASTFAFSKEIMKRGYYRQAAYYREILQSLGFGPVEVWFIIIEKGRHPRINVRKLAERAMDKGDFDNDDALQLYMRCKLQNSWPDFVDQPEITDAAPTIDMPDYAYGGSVDDLKGMTEIATEEPTNE